MEEASLRWTVVLLVVSLAVPAAAGSVGVAASSGGPRPDGTPVDGDYEGALVENQRSVHVFDTLDTVCGTAFTSWRVTLTYEPAEAVVDFSLHETATSEPHSAARVDDGHAELFFRETSTCAHEAIRLEGIDVDDLARYHVQVSRCGFSPCET